MYECYFCQTPLLSITHDTNFFHVSCLRCGVYRISAEAQAFIEPTTFGKEQAANISGYIRENQGLAILNADMPFLKSLRTPTVAEKAMKGLVALAMRFPEAGSPIPLGFRLLDERFLMLRAASADRKSITDACDDGLKEMLALQSHCWARSFAELEYIFSYYFKSERLAAESGGALVLTPKGWALADEVRRGSVQFDKAFVAMSFDPKFLPLFSEGLYPGIRAAGYDPIKIDRVEHNNRIDDEIIATIRRCKFLVADFSLNRGGIYFEAGFALGLGRPVIWTVRHDDLKDVHFDTRQYNFIRWNDDALPNFAKALQNRIEASPIGRGPLPPLD